MPLKFEVSTRQVQTELAKRLRTEAKKAADEGKITLEGLAAENDASMLLGAAAKSLGKGRPVDIDQAVDAAMLMASRVWKKFNKEAPETLDVEELLAMRKATGVRADQVSSVTSDAMQNAFFNKHYPQGKWDQLADDHPLNAAVQPIDTEWGDENIMNGVVNLTAGRLPKDFDLAELRTFACHTLGRRSFDEYEAPVDPATVKTQSVRATEQTLNTVVNRIHDGFFYRPSGISKEERATRLAGVQAALTPLGHLRSLVGARAEVQRPESEFSAEVRITAYVFANPKTLEFVRFYTVEGTG